MDTKILKYYKSEAEYYNGKPPKGVINFQQVWVEGDYNEKQLKINLSMVGAKRVFNLKCCYRSDFDNWSAKLKHAISTS